MTSQNVQYGDIVTYGIAYNEGTYNIFLNGRIVGNANSPDVPTITSFYLGYKSDSNEKGTGNIKSLKIYDRKLEPYEILANYQYELLDRNTNLYVNENNLPKIVDKLSNASNIKITGNKYGNRVQTVIDKIVEKADDVTKAIEQEVINDSYSFKVGTGDVDVSADVEDGFGEVGVKGVTYQNLVDKKVDVLNNELTNSTSIGVIYGSANKLKQNTTYTIFYKIKTNQTFNVTSMSSMFRIDVFHNNGTQTMPYGFKGQLSDSFKVVCEKFTLSSSDSITKIELNLRNAYGDYGLESNVLTVKEVVILEGDHTNNPNLPSYFEEIVGVGDKSKNLFNPNNIKQTVLTLGANNTEVIEGASSVRCSIRNIPCKPNTKYTFKSNKDIRMAMGGITKDNITFGDTGWINAKNGHTYTTPNNAVELGLNISKIDDSNITVDFVKGIDIQIEEGSVATEFVPYDKYKIEILSCGKNLVDINKITKSHSNNTFEIIGDRIKYTGYGISSFRQPRIPIYVKPNSDIIFTCKSVENTNVYVKLVTPNEETLYTNYDFKNNTVVTKNVANNTMIYLELGKHKTNLNDITIYDIQIEESTQATQYNSYVSDKTQILLDEPLMRLPNGVCDEITRDGKLIRRVGKIVFTGIESWNLSKTSDKTILFEVGVSNIKIDKRGDILPICDKLLASLQSNI